MRIRSTEQDALTAASRRFKKFTKAIREVEALVEIMRAEHDPLASHIFVSRRHYQNLSDTKSGTRRAMLAHISRQTACELGFRGSPVLFCSPRWASRK